VEAFSKTKNSFNGFVIVSINGMNMGTTSAQGPEDERWGGLDISLAPGKYEVMVKAEGFEPAKQDVVFVGKEHKPFVRLVMTPMPSVSEK